MLPAQPAIADETKQAMASLRIVDAFFSKLNFSEPSSATMLTPRI
ncbi:Unknown protein sequence [Pseudomonas syringae pv. aceris]|nr:Unknown protein sequence [Pseudomonas syringae pv. aceris]